MRIEDRCYGEGWRDWDKVCPYLEGTLEATSWKLGAKERRYQFQNE